jgi:predicted tellurium resistance membrane protein TerC
MDLITAILLFIGALLLAVGHNSPAVGCLRIGSVLLTVGFGLMLFGMLA